MRPTICDASETGTIKGCTTEADIRHRDTARTFHTPCGGRAKQIPCGFDAQSKRVANTLKHVQAHLFVEDSAAPTKNGLAVSKHIPGEAESRRKVVVIAVVGRKDS